MKQYEQMPSAELHEERGRLRKLYDDITGRKLSLNMARGKPGNEQLALSVPMLDAMTSTADCEATDGTDCRNYGELRGIVDARKLFGEYMGVSSDEIIVAGSSSLSLMYDCLARAMLKGVLGSKIPWGKCPGVKFLCPVPGYDRHHSICEFLGIEMIQVPINEEGPDMAFVEKITANDDTVKGIWCVPKFSNPLGITYSNETIRRLARIRAQAGDFRIFCDNSYAMHFIYRDPPLLNLLDECKKAGNPNLAYMFGSTSKITMPGAGVAFFAASRENIDFAAKQLSMQTIGWDKMNMLRHVRFLKNLANIRAHMKKHADILRPRFDIVIGYLQKELASCGIGSFIRPDGGYFVTYVAPQGCAKRIVNLCKEAGVILTDAGATHPYKNDPDDRYIRIAPSFPSLAELDIAMQIFCVSARLAAIDKIMKPDKRLQETYL
jgi:DNA-binding transcriptional MocR family regulator